jgi:hypothetical protein
MGTGRAATEIMKSLPAKPELNIMQGAISLAINELFDRAELTVIAGNIEHEIGLTHDKPICEYDLEALRNLITLRLQEIRKPEDVVTLKSILDATASAALAKS